MNEVNQTENIVGQMTSSIGESLEKINQITNGQFKQYSGLFDTTSNNSTSEEQMLEYLGYMKETFHMQDMFNKLVYPNWKQEGFNWGRAVRAEIGEAIDSYNWEWWKKKKGTPDSVNAEIELVDTFHFLISYCTVNAKDDNQTNTIATTIFTLAMARQQQMLKVAQTEGVKKFDQELFIKAGEELIKFSLVNPEQYQILFLKFFDMWFMLNPNNGIETLLKLYRAKNILNAFRQSHGYKTGSYIKIWGEEEDNMVCWQLAKPLNLNSNFHNVLMEQLEESYSHFV